MHPGLTGKSGAALIKAAPSWFWPWWVIASGLSALAGQYYLPQLWPGWALVLALAAWLVVGLGSARLPPFSPPPLLLLFLGLIFTALYLAVFWAGPRVGMDSDLLMFYEKGPQLLKGQWVVGDYPLAAWSMMALASLLGGGDLSHFSLAFTLISGGFWLAGCLALPRLDPRLPLGGAAACLLLLLPFHGFYLVGRLDALVCGQVLLIVWAWLGKRPLLATLVVALGFWSKGLPIFLWPFMALAWLSTGQLKTLAASAVLLAALLAAPFALFPAQALWTPFVFQSGRHLTGASAPYLLYHALEGWNQAGIPYQGVDPRGLAWQPWLLRLYNLLALAGLWLHLARGLRRAPLAGAARLAAGHACLALPLFMMLHPVYSPQFIVWASGCWLAARLLAGDRGPPWPLVAGLVTLAGALNHLTYFDMAIWNRYVLVNSFFWSICALITFLLLPRLGLPWPRSPQRGRAWAALLGFGLLALAGLAWEGARPYLLPEAWAALSLGLYWLWKPRVWGLVLAGGFTLAGLGAVLIPLGQPRHVLAPGAHFLAATGQTVKERTAPAGQARVARAGRDRAGYLAFGRYRRWPSGPLAASFSLAYQGPPGPVAQVEINLDHGREILAQRTVNASELAPAGSYHQIALETLHRFPRRQVELRVKWLGWGELRLGGVDVRTGAWPDPWFKAWLKDYRDAAYLFLDRILQLGLIMAGLLAALEALRGWRAPIQAEAAP